MCIHVKMKNQQTIKKNDKNHKPPHLPAASWLPGHNFFLNVMVKNEFFDDEWKSRKTTKIL